jgi:hypothetical protein
MVDAHADLHAVRVFHQGRLVAEHPRSWATGTTITDPAHVSAAAALRQVFQQRPAPQPLTDPLVRDLAEYDRAFGIEVA